MEEQNALPFLRETLVFLALAGILIPLLQRLRINQVLGFLAVGALLGPAGLGLWSDRFPWLSQLTFTDLEGVKVLGELGVLFLMFMIGLELSAARLWSLRGWVFGAGTAQVTLCGLAIGFIAWLFGNSPGTSLLLGLALSLSSTAVVMQLLTNSRSLAQPLGQAGFSILMLQDLAVVPLFLLIAVLSDTGNTSVTSMVLGAMTKSVLAITLIYLLGRRVIRPLFRSLVGQHQPEVFMALTLLCTLGIAGLTAMAGLSLALGALLAGLLLAETEFRHEVEVTIEPFKGLLMGLFFMWVGMQTDIREIMKAPVLLPLSVLGLFAIKSTLTSLILRAGGFSWGRAFEGGLLLGQGGEFAFIVVGAAMTATIMDRPTGQFVMLVVALSMFATPLLARLGTALRKRLEHRERQSSGGGFAIEGLAPLSEHVIIVGYGRVGQLLSQVLESQGVPFVAIENDADVVARLHPAGVPIYFGNAGRTELLDRVHAAHAAAIVLTMDDPDSALRAVEAIRRSYPELPLFARARDEGHAFLLLKAGASQVIPETLETGLQLAVFALQSLGIAESEAAHLTQLERERRIACIDSAS
ncbi:cation:proton antiporter domain-containing protein [Lacisediminimonas profundi]|uniref:cation:proton antiporter domain-containing protein n=1 Tax=Lacisediminimonas profundi TaxID=2603856 RepID=UPI00124B0037|nr:cation:proton antiporter [Lacisediminimonas profundi]